MGRSLQDQVAKRLLGPSEKLNEACQQMVRQEPLTQGQYQALLHVAEAQKNLICELVEVVADLAGRV